MFGRYSSVVLVAVLGVIVSVPALAGPAQARPTVVATDAEGSGEITSLIVAYEPGAAPTDSNGDVTGAVAVPDAELAPGKALGFGLRTVSFDEPTSTAEAEVVADQLAASPQVAWAEPNYRVSVSNDQANPSWGLDRIDQRSRPLDGVYSYDSSGAGVTAYIVDTGIRSTHSDFGGRVAAG